MDLHTSPVAWKVIGCAIEVHRVLGPGLLESPYGKALAAEFASRGVRFQQQVPLPGTYKGEALQLVFIHRAQLRTYLRILGLRQGLLLNFNMPRLVDGLTSVLLPERD
jgi:hypothetical protein